MNDFTPETIPQDNLIILEDNLADQHDEQTILDENTIILASHDAYSILEMQKLKSGLKEAGLSYEDVAEQEDISVSSIYKFFSQTSKSPSFYNVAAIIHASGLPADEVCKLFLKKKKPAEQAETIAAMQKKIDMLQSTVESMQKTIDANNTILSQLIAEIRRRSPTVGEDY